MTSIAEDETTETTTEDEYVKPRWNAKASNMSEEEVDRIRSQHPDDPVALPDDALACENCGVAVADCHPPVEVFTPAERLAMNYVWIPKENFARCTDCQMISTAAETYVDEHPALRVRLGSLAFERVEATMHGLSVLDLHPSDDDLWTLLPRMSTASIGLKWSSPLTQTPRKGLCGPYAWSHVSMSKRADLRKAYADSLRDRLALSAPPVPIVCPSGGCLLCGVAEIERSAIEARRGGGPHALVPLDDVLCSIFGSPSSPIEITMLPAGNCNCVPVMKKRPGGVMRRR